MFSPHFSNHHRFPATDARVPKNANSATVKQLDSVVEENTLKLFQWTSPYRQKARLVFGARQILLDDLTERVDAELVTDPGDNSLPKTFICRAYR